MSAETERTYLSRVNVFSAWADEHELDIDTADRAAIEAYVQRERSRVAPNTVRNTLYGLRSYYDFLISRGLRTDNPTTGLKVKRSKTLPKQPVCDEDVKRLTYGANSLRDKAIVALFYASGIRLAELAEIRIEHVLWNANTILIHGKGDKWRTVRPGADVMTLLKEVAGGRTQGALWLVTRGATAGEPMKKRGIRKNFGRLCERKHVKAHPHQLRATFANNALKAGMDLGAVQEAMGHEDPAMTLHYARGTALERAMSGMEAMNLAGRIL